jgi:hypothetical protein
VAQLRFCIDELHRRQQTDRRRAWLWQLKEKAARQALVMLKFEVGGDAGDLSPTEQQQIMARDSLLQDPRAALTSNVPAWRRELQARARRVLQQSLEQIQRRREQSASALQE